MPSPRTTPESRRLRPSAPDEWLCPICNVDWTLDHYIYSCDRDDIAKGELIPYASTEHLFSSEQGGTALGRLLRRTNAFARPLPTAPNPAPVASPTIVPLLTLSPTLRPDPP